MMLLMRGKVEKSEAGQPRSSGIIYGWSHQVECRASDFSTFLLNSYIPSLGLKAQSDTHYSSKR